MNIKCGYKIVYLLGNSPIKFSQRYVPKCTMKMYNENVQWKCTMKMHNENAQWKCTMKMHKENVQWNCTMKMFG